MNSVVGELYREPSSLIVGGVPAFATAFEKIVEMLGGIAGQLKGARSYTSQLQLEVRGIGRHIKEAVDKMNEGPLEKAIPFLELANTGMHSIAQSSALRHSEEFLFVQDSYLKLESIFIKHHKDPEMSGKCDDIEIPSTESDSSHTSVKPVFGRPVSGSAPDFSIA